MSYLPSSKEAGHALKNVEQHTAKLLEEAKNYGDIFTGVKINLSLPANQHRAYIQDWIRQIGGIKNIPVNEIYNLLGTVLGTADVLSYLETHRDTAIEKLDLESNRLSYFSKDLGNGLRELAEASKSITESEALKIKKIVRIFP